MIDNVLELNGLTVEILQKLSYNSQLGKSLKNNLHHFNRDDLLTELKQVSRWFNRQDILENIALDYRVKSYDSILLKYERYYPNRQLRQVFNDIIGFRGFCDSYEDILYTNSNVFRIVDMTTGKSNDDGYRCVHIYYQLDNFHYPIEIQFNTLYDRQINNWLHIFLYKKNFPNIVGREMRKRYENGEIRNDKEFKEVLNHVLCDR